jgi:valyl-tRNA synthetase
MPILLEVNPMPVLPTTIPDLTQCDTDSNNLDGLSTFNLTVQNASINALNTPTANYSINYFTSLAAATAGTSSIVGVTAFNNGSNPQTIWVVVKNTITGCKTIGTFKLIVNVPLALTAPTPLRACDDDASPNDLHTTFDLTVKNDEITGITGSTGYTINYYHSTVGNVLPLPYNGVIPATYQLVNPTAYVNNGPLPAVETLAVEVIDNATGCKNYITLTIRVLPIPTPRTTGIPNIPAVCETTAHSGIATGVNLTASATYIMNNDPNVTLHYFTQSPTDSDILNHTHEIMTPNNATIGTPQTTTPLAIDLVQYVYVAVTSNQFIDSQTVPCYKVVPLGFIVNPLPVLTPNLVYQICEGGTTGVAVFDLTSMQTSLSADVTNVTTPVSTYTYTYYTDAAHANQISAADVVAFTNTSNPQTIYVQMTNTTESSM